MAISADDDALDVALRVAGALTSVGADLGGSLASSIRVEP